MGLCNFQLKQEVRIDNTLSPKAIENTPPRPRIREMSVPAEASSFINARFANVGRLVQDAQRKERVAQYVIADPSSKTKNDMQQCRLVERRRDTGTRNKSTRESS